MRGLVLAHGLALAAAGCGDSAGDDFQGDTGSCRSYAELEGEAAIEACSDLAAASTCGNGRVDPGEHCYSLQTLADFEPVFEQQPVLAAVDADGDEFTDIIAIQKAEDNDRELVVYWNDGDGGFAETTTPPIASGLLVGSVHAADIDDDGQQDLTVASPALVLFGAGERTFGAEALPFELGWSVAADMNADGTHELLVTADEETIVYSNAGSRTFEAGDALSIDGAPVWLAREPEDLTGDGQLDLVVYAQTADAFELWVLDAGGEGDLSQATRVAEVPYGLIGVLDVEGDGVSEIAAVVVDSDLDGAHETLQLWSLSAEPLGTAMATRPHKQGGSIHAVLSGDVNGDVHGDLLLARGYGQRPSCELPPAARSVQLLLGDGNGGFEEPACHLAFARSYYDVAAADFNDDGITDIAAITGAGLELILSTP